MNKKYTGTGASDDPEVEALAEAWASIDGKKEQFLKEKAIVKGDFYKGCIAGEGRYAGYKAEAEEMINRLNKAGFDVVPIRKAVLRVVR